MGIFKSVSEWWVGYPYGFTNSNTGTCLYIVKLRRTITLEGDGRISLNISNESEYMERITSHFLSFVSNMPFNTKVKTEVVDFIGLQNLTRDPEDFATSFDELNTMFGNDINVGSQLRHLDPLPSPEGESIEGDYYASYLGGDRDIGEGYWEYANSDNRTVYASDGNIIKFNLKQIEGKSAPEYIRDTGSISYNQENSVAFDNLYDVYNYAINAKINNPIKLSDTESKDADDTDSKDNNNDGTDGTDLKDNDTVDEPEDSPLNCEGAINNYVISSDTTKNIFKWFWNDMIEQARTDNILEYLSGIYGNIGNCLVGVRMYPFSVSSGDATDMILGRFNSQIELAKLDSSSNLVAHYRVDVKGYYGNFLDYAPYTKTYLWLPYIGLRELDTNIIIGKTLNIKYFCDFTTGGLDVYIMIDDTAYQMYSGRIGADIPYSLDGGLSVTDVAINSAMTVGMSTAGSLVGGAVGAMVGGAISSAFTNPPQESQCQLSNGQPVNGNVMNAPKNCQLIMHRPQYKEPSTYGKNIGFVCRKSYTLEDVNGFAIINNPKISYGNTKNSDNTIVYPSESEMAEIISLLESGVYL